MSATDQADTRQWPALELRGLIALALVIDAATIEEALAAVVAGAVLLAKRR